MANREAFLKEQGEPRDSQQEVLKDPKTGEWRWSALSPAQLDVVKDKETSFGEVMKVMPAMVTGTIIDQVGNTFDRLDRDQKRLQGMQSTIWSALSNEERTRFREELARTATVKAQGRLTKPSDITDTFITSELSPQKFKEILDKNPVNEEVLDKISGDEHDASWGEMWRRIATKIVAIRDPYGVVEARNLFGAEDPSGGISGYSKYQGLEDKYEREGLRPPAFPGASGEVHDWLETADAKGMTGGQIYRTLFAEPFEDIARAFGTDESAGQLVHLGADKLREIALNESLRESYEKPLVPPDTGFGDILDPNTWNGSKGEDALPWHDLPAFALKSFEQIPYIVESMVPGRMAGKFAAGQASKQFAGRGIDFIEKKRRLYAKVGGVIGGGSAEGAMIYDQVYSEVAEALEAVPMERLREDPQFMAIVGTGVTEETAKQMLIHDAASTAGRAGFVWSAMVVGSPMQAAFGSSGAGSLLRRNTLARVGTIAALDPMFEGVQEVVEGVTSDIGIGKVDPNNPIFSDKGRHFTRAISGFAFSAPSSSISAVGALSPEVPAGYEPGDVAAAEATKRFMEARDARFAKEFSISTPEYIAQHGPHERLVQMEKLEKLQEAEAKSIIEMEPILNDYFIEHTTRTSESEQKMLKSLKMFANATLSDIAVAKSRRTTAQSLAEEQDAILKERATLQTRINESVIKLEDIDRMASSIETVQNNGLLGAEDQEELLREGYARKGKNQQLIVTAKGKRAIKELMRQKRGLESRLNTGYVGSERRKPAQTIHREKIDMMGPAAREAEIYQDLLTGVGNERAFDRTLQQIASRDFTTSPTDALAKLLKGMNDDDKPAFAAMDVDGLKWVNDNMDHAGGDRLLIAVADALSEEEDIIPYRKGKGSDEFAIVGRNEAEIEAAMQRVAKKLSNTEITEGSDIVSPQITWATGPDIKTADKKAIAMKSERQDAGKVADRKGRPVTYRTKEQMGLFMKGRTGVPIEMTQSERAKHGERAKQVIKMSREGKSQADISREIFGEENYRLHTGYISRVLTRAGLSPDPNQLTEKEQSTIDKLDSGMKQADVAREEGVSTGNISRRVASARKKLKRQKGRSQKKAKQQLNEQQELQLEKEVQLGLFQDDLFDGSGLPSTWAEVRGMVERGDTVEVLTPSGAIRGTITNISHKRGRPRMKISIQKREFVFNPDRNWLIVTPLTDLADVAWITGDPEYIAGTDAIPQTIEDVQIGHIGVQGMWFADLGKPEVKKKPIPYTFPSYKNQGWFPAYKQWKYVAPKLSEAEVIQSQAVFETIAGGFHPSVRNKINLVTDIAEFKKDHPQVLEQMIAEGGAGILHSVKGYMDHLSEDGDIYIFLTNINMTPASMAMAITEVVTHETIGHYGVRGVFGDEAELRPFMHELVDEFVDYARFMAPKIGASSKDVKNLEPIQKQLLGEEMVAYIAGEVASGKAKMNPRQKKVWARFIQWVKDWLVAHGFNRFAPIKKITSGPVSSKRLQETREEFWSDKRVVDLLARSRDFVREGKRWHWRAIDDNTGRFIRDADIFQAGLVDAMNTGTVTLSKRERKERAPKAGGIENVPKTVPMFPESGSPNAFKAGIERAVSEKLLTKKELTLSALDEKSLDQVAQELYGKSFAQISEAQYGDNSAQDIVKTKAWSFFRDLTYGDILHLHNTIAPGGEPGWYHNYMPKQLADEMEAIKQANRKNMMVGPLLEGQPETHRTSIDQAIVEANMERRGDILNMPIDMKKTTLTKPLMLAYMRESERVFRIKAVRANAQAGSQGEYRPMSKEEAGRKLFGDMYDPDNISVIGEDMIKQEQELAMKRGWDIGYSEEQQRWLDYTDFGEAHEGMTAQGGRFGGDYRVTVILQQGAGKKMGGGGHYGKNLMHIRTGVAEALLGIDGAPIMAPAPNPAMDNKPLVLAELQSDWLQSQRKQWGSQRERREGNAQLQRSRRILANATKQFGGKASADLWTGFHKKISWLGDMVAAPNDPVWSTPVGQVLKPKLDEYTRDQFGVTYDEQSESEQENYLEGYRDAQIEKMIEHAGAVRGKIQTYRDEVNDYIQNIDGSMDARAFTAMDKLAVSYFASTVMDDLAQAIDTLQSIKNTTSNTRRKGFVDDAKSGFMRRVARFSENSSYYEGVWRMPYASAEIEKMLKPIYEWVGVDSSLLSDAITSIQEKDTATIRLNLQTVRDLSDAQFATTDIAQILEPIFEERNVLAAGLQPNDFSFLVGEPAEDHIDIEVIAPQGLLTDLADQIPVLIKEYIKEKASYNRRTNIESAQRRNAMSADDIDVSDVTDYIDFGDIDTDSDSSEMNQYDLTSFETYEENNISDQIDYYANEMYENMDWDGVENSDGEGLWEGSPAYEEHVEVDEEGDRDESDADEWLNNAQVSYRDEELRDDDGVMDNASTAVRDAWFEGETSKLKVGLLPTAWSSTGAEESYVDIAISEEYGGEQSEIWIDGDKQDYEWGMEDAERELAKWIKDYYDTNAIIPPRGTLFGAEDTTSLTGEAKQVDEASRAAEPNWDIVSSNISSQVSITNGKPINTRKAFEDFVRLSKKRDRVGIDSPLSSDSDWRGVALDFLLMDAVRRGAPGIVWHNGLASSRRGGMGMGGTQRQTHISWSRETMELSGGAQEVFVIKGSEREHPIVLSRNQLVTALGGNVAGYMQLQIEGKRPLGQGIVDVSGRDAFLIGQTTSGVMSVHRRSDNQFIGFAETEAEIDALIHTETLVLDEGDAGIMRGDINERDVGSIFLIPGPQVSDYQHTFQVPKLAGARNSYENISRRVWNSKLKKYDVQIRDAYIKLDDVDTAITEEGQEPISSGARQDEITAAHDSLSIEELTGETHGWVVVSGRHGPIIEDVFLTNSDAQAAMSRFINDNFADDRLGARVQYIEVNDKIREAYAGPVAPFMVDDLSGPDNEDEYLKSAAKKIGYTPTPLSERLKLFFNDLKNEVQQGAFDDLHGIIAALRTAGASDVPYMKARLSRGIDGMMKAVLYQGGPVWKDGIMQTEGKGLVEILSPIMRGDMAGKQGLYMATTRGKRLMLEGYEQLNTESKVRIEGAINTLPGDPDVDRMGKVWQLLVMHDKGEFDHSAAIHDLTADEKASLTTQEQLYWYEFLPHTKRKTRDKSLGRHRVFDWRIESTKNTGTKIAAKYNNAIDDLMRNHGIKTELEAENIVDKLTDLALKKQAEADVDRKTLNDARLALTNLIVFGREQNFTPAELEAGMRLGDAYPVLKRVAADYAVFNKQVLDFAEAAGTIDPEGRVTWEHADYVPLYRVQDDRIAGPMGRLFGISNIPNPIRTLRGGGQVSDIIHNIMINTVRLIDSAHKNSAAVAVVDELKGSGIIASEPMAYKPVLIPMAQVRKKLFEAGLTKQVVDPKTGKKSVKLMDIPNGVLEGYQKMFAVGAPSGPGIISILRKGKREYYQTTDEFLYRAMTEINKKSWSSAMNIFTAPKRLYTEYTTLAPGFAVANFTRDTAAAAILSRDAFIPLAGGIKGFYEALTVSDAMKMMISSGAAFERGYVTSNDPNSTEKLLKRAMMKRDAQSILINSPRLALQAYKALLNAAENANRVAVFNAAQSAGKSTLRSSYESKDIMDFSMGGDWTIIQFLIRSSVFLGARIAGSYRLGRGFMENPVAFTVKGGLLAMAGLALWFAFRDDERYKALPEYQKDLNFNWWIGDDHYALPKPFEIGALFNTIPERIFEFMYSQENDAGKLLMRRWAFMMAETFALNPIPQVALPAVESLFNYDFFRDQKIVPEYMGQRLAPEQYRHYTSPTMIELARWLPKDLEIAGETIRSPLQLQHLFEGYTSTLGRYILQVSDSFIRRQMDYPLPPTRTPAAMPVIGRFYKGDTPPRTTKYAQEFYDIVNRTTAIQGSMRFLKETGQVERYIDTHAEELPYIRAAKSVESVREDVQNVNKAIIEVEMHPDMVPDEKRKQIDQLQEMKNKLLQEGWKLRPGGFYNPPEPMKITGDEVTFLINQFGIDNSEAYKRRLNENSPDTYELLEMIGKNMSKRNLESLAKAGAANE
jgi:GGDEF domain-containing protein